MLPEPRPDPHWGTLLAVVLKQHSADACSPTPGRFYRPLPYPNLEYIVQSEVPIVCTMNDWCEFQCDCPQRTGRAFCVQVRFSEEKLLIAKLSAKNVRIRRQRRPGAVPLLYRLRLELLLGPRRRRRVVADTVGAFADTGFPQPTLSVSSGPHKYRVQFSGANRLWPVFHAAFGTFTNDASTRCEVDRLNRGATAS